MNEDKIPEQCIPGITRLVEYWIFKAFTAGVTAGISATNVHGLKPEDEQRARFQAKTITEKLHVENALREGVFKD